MAFLEGHTVLRIQDREKDSTLERALGGMPFYVEPIGEHRRLAIFKHVLPPCILARANSHMIRNEIGDMPHVASPKGAHPNFELRGAPEIRIELLGID